VSIPWEIYEKSGARDGVSLGGVSSVRPLLGKDGADC